jgi:4'-phosphopantetheinyl transferase
MHTTMLKQSTDMTTHDLASSHGAGPLISFRPAPLLPEKHIHVWTISDRPYAASDYLPLLSRKEADRAFALRTSKLFDRFVADHGTLRLLLSAYLETDPRTLNIVTNQYGKPYLENYPRRLRFNMSHSGEITVIALCLDAEIGIDVEAVRPIAEWSNIAASNFSESENQALHREVPSQRMEVFFRCWTRKEAFIKAVGMGLSIPLDSFAVSSSLTEPPVLLSCAWDENATSRWSLMHLEPATAHVGALAVETSGWSTLQFAWP